MKHKVLTGSIIAGLFASSAAIGQGDAVTIQLQAQNNSGENGTATLTPEGDGTRVVIKLSGAPAGVSQPAHIHGGSCDKLDKPKHMLEDVVNGNSTTLVAAKLDTIMTGTHAINVHKSAQDLKTYVACGNLKKG